MTVRLNQCILESVYKLFEFHCYVTRFKTFYVLIVRTTAVISSAIPFVKVTMLIVLILFNRQK